MNIHADQFNALLRSTWDEKEFQKQVIALAHDLGWKVAHFRPAKTAKGWRTPVEADGEGFVDLELVRERVVHAELKVKGRKPSPKQRQWFEWLMAAKAEVYLWYPENWEEIVATLARRKS